MIGRAGIDNFGHSGYAVHENALESCFEGHSRGRARHTRTNKFDSDETGLLVDIVKQNVSVVGLNRRTDDFDDLLYLFAHPPSLGTNLARTTPDRSTTRLTPIMRD